MTRIQSATLLLRRFPQDIRIANHFRVATYSILMLVLVGAGLTLVSHPLIALLLASILCGWSELNGLCGSSHVLAITPLRALDGSHHLWRKSVLSYTAAGIATAAFMGAGLGTFGRLLGAGTQHIIVAIAVLAIVLAARELRYVDFNLPQVRRQTNRMWAFQFGFVPAAAMWGAHIGIGFATVIAHGGFYVLVGFALTQGPLIGSLITVAYWVGRALPICIAPALTANDKDAEALTRLVLEYQSPYRHAAAVGLMLAACVALRLSVSQ